MKCKICDGELTFRDTDRNTIKACEICGAVYDIEGENPVLAINDPQKIEWLKEYFAMTGRNCCPGAFCMGASPNDPSSEEDKEIFKAFLKRKVSEVSE